jgi:hypothetical protein
MAEESVQTKSTEAVTQRSNATNLIGAGVSLPCGFAVIGFREPICGEVQRSTET